MYMYNAMYMYMYVVRYSVGTNACIHTCTWLYMCDGICRSPDCVNCWIWAKLQWYTCACFAWVLLFTASYIVHVRINIQSVHVYTMYLYVYSVCEPIVYCELYMWDLIIHVLLCTYVHNLIHVRTLCIKIACNVNDCVCVLGVVHLYRCHSCFI